MSGHVLTDAELAAFGATPPATPAATRCDCPVCVRTEISAWVFVTSGSYLPLLLGREPQRGLLAQRWGIA